MAIGFKWHKHKILNVITVTKALFTPDIKMHYFACLDHK